MRRGGRWSDERNYRAHFRRLAGCVSHCVWSTTRGTNRCQGRCSVRAGLRLGRLRRAQHRERRLARPPDARGDTSGGQTAFACVQTTRRSLLSDQGASRSDGIQRRHGDGAPQPASLGFPPLRPHRTSDQERFFALGRGSKGDLQDLSGRGTSVQRRLHRNQAWLREARNRE